MKLIRKLIVGISTVGLLVMTFVSATYAWFEINSRASVENFHFEVNGGQGFLVSIDDVHYYNSLNLTQLQKAMLVAYGEGEYRLSTDGTETLYHIDYVDGFDPMGNPIVKEDPKKVEDSDLGDLISGKVTGVPGVKLLPTTTTDGRYLTDLYNSESKPSDGRFLQFSVYFKATSDREQDNYAYEIYLNGEEGRADNDALIEPTRITSERSEVPLSANMNVVLNTDAGKKIYALKRTNSLGGRDKVSVYSSNAVRLSITNQEYYEEYQKNPDGSDALDGEGNKILLSGYKLSGDNPTRIYELNDTVNKNTDLGSYATNYAGEYTDAQLEAMVTEEGTLINDEKLSLYCSKFNAMYTYYNNLKPDDPLTYKLLDYNVVEQINTIRDLSGKQTITTVRSGEKAKLLTFRLWLEGWDADCFDGIEYAVKARLSFGSRKVSS